MEQAYINPEVARWARERRGFTQDALASKLKVSNQQITQWESGPHFPPFRKAQDLARVLDIPFGYLFLSNLPVDKPAIPDLRRVGPGDAQHSPEFIDLLNDIVVKHDWYIDYAKENGAARLPFVGRRSLDVEPARTASDIRSVLAPNEIRREARNPGDYLRLLCNAADDAGIIVMRSGVALGNPRRRLSVAEFRGFAICNRVAPLIFINSRDAIAAQVFTLAHELAHIWVGESGISNPDLSQRSLPKANRETIEQYCNEVAAELLVPEEEFSALWGSRTASSDERSQSLSKTFRVSVPVILRRALELNRISLNEFFSLWRAHGDRTKVREEKEDEEESGGGNFYNTFFARNSRRLTEAILTVVKTGKMGALEGARLLNIRTATLPKLAERIGAQ